MPRERPYRVPFGFEEQDDRVVGHRTIDRLGLAADQARPNAFDIHHEVGRPEPGPHEQIARLAAVKDAWTIDNGAMTSTMTVKRNEVENSYAPLIESEAAVSAPDRLGVTVTVTVRDGIIPTWPLFAHHVSTRTIDVPPRS